MRLGSFTKIFVRDSFEQVLDGVAGNGLTAIQLNLDSVVGEPMPDAIAPETCNSIRNQVAAKGIELAAVSGTFNIIHPNRCEREQGFRRLRALAAACAPMGAPRITFSTGTCNTDYMWGDHPDNRTPQAWAKMLEAMADAVHIAAEFSVPLVFEPEVSNIVDTAAKARRLLDHFDSPFLKVVIDGANLFHVGELVRMQEILDEAFELLGPDIQMAHAKDLVRDGEAGNVAAGTGLLNYEHYLRKLGDIGFDGALILHSLDEAQVPESVAFVRSKLAALGG